MDGADRHDFATQRAQPHEGRTCTLSGLPHEAQERIARCLLGVELFALSHVNSDALQAFSQRHLWTPRLAPPDQCEAIASPTRSPKRKYIRRCRSLSFPARDTKRWAELGRLSPARVCVPVCATMRDAFGSWGQPFSFETWFSLSRAASGGVLLGAQSIRLSNNSNSIINAPVEEPSSYAQLVSVDAERNLFCSVIACTTRSHTSPVALALELHRWHHLALVYEGGSESVYLDGQLVKTVRGSLPRVWRSLYAAQVGTGYVGADSSSSSSTLKASGSGWCDFRGVLDSFRVYRFALPAASIRRLADAPGEQTEDASELDEPAFCIKRDLSSRSKARVVAHCSRPQERWCRAIPEMDAEETLDSLLDMI